MKLSPLIKGLITGALMVALSFYLFYSKTPTDAPVTYLIYAFYAAGILWTLIGYSRTPQYTGKFGDIFAQGFRCFVIVTILMVLYIVFLIKSHPEMKEEAAVYYREVLVKEKNNTPAEIDQKVEENKKQFLTGNVSITIFGTLLMGAIFTAAGAGYLIMRRK